MSKNPDSINTDDRLSSIHLDLTARESAILNGISQGIIVTNLQEQIALFNPAAERLFGYSSAEVIGRSPVLLYAPGTLDGIMQTLSERGLPPTVAGLIELSAATNGARMYCRKDGSALPCQLSITELRNDDGVTIGYLGLITDLSDRARITAIEQREQQLIAHISRGTNASVGEKFFDQLINELKEAIGTDFADLFALDPTLPGLSGRLRNAPSLPLFSESLDLAGTPFEPALRNAVTLHLKSTDYPQLRTPMSDIEEALAVPLIASSGNVLGALLVAHRGALPEPELIRHLLEIFAVRASSELERMHAEQSLQAREADQRWLFLASERINGQSDVASVTRETVVLLAAHRSKPAVTMVIRRGDDYHVAAYEGPPHMAPRRQSYPHQAELIHAALAASGSILLFPNYLEHLSNPEDQAEARARDLQSMALILLSDHDQIIGAITLAYPDPTLPAELDADAMAMLGRSVGLALTRAQQRSALEYQANHDSLTGLFNRTVLHRDFDAWLSHGGARTALLLLDLDRFKEVNDTLGHHVGDALLRQIGDRLRAGINYSEATLARLGGDEFAILLREDNLGVERAHQLAGGMLQALRQPFMANGINLEIGASVGVALYPDHGEDSHALLRSADVAMYEAKRSGGGVALYNRNLDFNSPERLALITDLGTGIRERELELFYQPKLDLRSGRVVGLEALLRWRHPRLGLLTPDRFLPLAEMSDAIHSLTALVLDMACMQLRDWLAAEVDTTLAVNLSARNLIDDRVVRQLAELLHFYQIPRDRLELEITETALIHDPDYARHLLERIAALGVRLSIDDFGTGYSSLAHLRQMPISTLKIDRTFIRDMLTNPQDQLIVRSIIQLAHNLELSVIAEGVESAAVLTQLAEMGCDQAQGYYFTRPLPINELQHWLICRGASEAQAESGGSPENGRAIH